MFVVGMTTRTGHDVRNAEKSFSQDGAGTTCRGRATDPRETEYPNAQIFFKSRVPLRQGLGVGRRAISRGKG